MIQLAYHTMGLKSLPLAEALGTVARMGFRYVDLATEPHLPLAEFVNRQKIVEVRDLLALYTLSISDLSVRLPDVLADDTYRRQHAVDTFKGILPFVKAIEANSITLQLPTDSNNMATQDLSKRLRPLLQQAIAADVALRVVSAPDTALDSLSAMTDLLEHLPEIGLTLDWGHLVYRGASHNDLSAMLPRTQHIILRQAKPYSAQVAHDAGMINFQQMMRTLRVAQYDHTISVALFSGSERHHIEALDPVIEGIALRDALRDARRMLLSTDE